MAHGAGHAQERPDDVVWSAYAFGKLHEAMKGLQGVMQDALEGFVSGDADQITRSAAMINPAIAPPPMLRFAP